jgi:hypothetical protein
VSIVSGTSTKAVRIKESGSSCLRVLRPPRAVAKCSGCPCSVAFTTTIGGWLDEVRVSRDRDRSFRANVITRFAPT